MRKVLKEIIKQRINENLPATGFAGDIRGWDIPSETSNNINGHLSKFFSDFVQGNIRTNVIFDGDNHTIKQKDIHLDTQTFGPITSDYFISFRKNLVLKDFERLDGKSVVYKEPLGPGRLTAGTFFGIVIDLTRVAAIGQGRGKARQSTNETTLMLIYDLQTGDVISVYYF